MSKKDIKNLVSVIIPVYNGELYLAEAISSVINQSYAQIEVIAVDDGSTDRSAEIIKSFGRNVTYLFQANSGTAKARNFGIKNAGGSYFAFLDQDDLWLENKIELQISAFRENNSFDIVYGHVKQFLSPDLDKNLKESLICPDTPMPGYLPSAMLVRNEAYFNVGFFDPNWKIGEWANWYVRSCEKNLNTLMLSDVVAFRRIHAENKGILQRNSIGEYIHILKASLDRRRSIK